MTDSNFWQNVDLKNIKMVFIAFSNHSSNLNTSHELHKLNPAHIKIGSVCEFRDQAKELHDEGVHFIYNFREQIGKEFANEFILNHKS